MIWIWLIARQSHKWATGPLDQYFSFVCARCGVSTAAMVRMFGFGSGSNPMAAQLKAHASAQAFGYRATTAAACPHCAELQATTIAQFEHAAKKSARRAMLRIPVALAAAFVLLVVLAIPAISDLHESIMLSVVAVSTAAAVGAMLFAILSGPVVTPSTNPTGVWFSRDPSLGPGSWFPAQPGRAPFVPQPAGVLRGLALVAMGVTAISSLVALVMWTETFRKVYVVNSDRSADLTVKIDNGPETHIRSDAKSDDVANAVFEVRTSRRHDLVTKTADGRVGTYELDASDAKHGWLVAPAGRSHGLCLASIKWYYGRKPSADEDESALLNKDTDIFALPRSFDYVLTAPPSTIQTQNGSSETRTTLRGLDCSALSKGDIVPFKNR
jgi:hypothetical protein